MKEDWDNGPVGDSPTNQHGSAWRTIKPFAGVDLRTDPASELRYPTASVLIVAGIPGAGKTTLMRRIFGISGTETQPVCTAEGVHVLDSEQSRNYCRRCFHGIPYGVWRPAVHLLQYVRILRILSRKTPVVIHETGTRFWIPSTIRFVSALRGWQLHVVLLDVPPPVAAASQSERKRVVRRRTFEMHCRRWQRRTASGPTGLIAGAKSAVIISRSAAEHLRAICFGSTE